MKIKKLTIRIVKWTVIFASFTACFMWIKYKFEHADGYAIWLCYKDLIPQGARNIRIGGVGGFGSSSLYISCNVSKEAVEEFAKDYNYRFYVDNRWRFQGLADGELKAVGEIVAG